MGRQSPKCSEHADAPPCVVCVHIVAEVPQQHWFALPTDSSSEVLYDWMCRECLANEHARVGATGLPVRCGHCVHALMKAQNPLLHLPGQDEPISVKEYGAEFWR